MRTIIGHLDMDAFFAAIEERNNPRFTGLPIVVGADPKEGYGRGVVSTANYAARLFGIGSAMPIRRAWRIAQRTETAGGPKIIFLPGSYSAYAKVSKNIMQIIQRHVSHTQQRSVDEAYLDLSFTPSVQEAERVCRSIRKDIIEQERLTCSIGIAPNKLVAKIACDYDKPNGLTVVKEHQVEKFLAPLPVRAIPGVGPKTSRMLQKMGVDTIQDARRFSREMLEEHFGVWGSNLYDKVRGSGSSVLEDEGIAKSIGRHVTFEKDMRNPSVIIESVTGISSHLIQRLSQDGFSSFRTVAVTVRFSNFTTRSKTHTQEKHMFSARHLQQEAFRLLLPFLDHRANPKHLAIRMIGIRLEKIE